MGRDVREGPANLAFRTFIHVDGLLWARLLDLHLPAAIEGMDRFRLPEQTDILFVIKGQVPDDVRQGCDYMLVGSDVRFSDGVNKYVLSWPQLSEHSGHIKLCSENHQICALAELFAGGMGAWSQACSHLPVQVTRSIDCKRFAVQSLQLNKLWRHEAACEHVAIDDVDCADVADIRVLAKLADEEGFMASPPCQGFSNLGKGMGLEARVASAWEAMFKTLRLSQRRFLLLENVVGLLKHRDFHEIRTMLQWCGYTIVHQMVCDATSMGCASRARLLIIAWNNAEWRQQMTFLSRLPCDVVPPPKPVSCTQAGGRFGEASLTIS